LSTHSYVVAPIAIAPTPAMNAAKRSFDASLPDPTSNSQSSEFPASAMKPSMLVAV
jgi:hypothetical protein